MYIYRYHIMGGAVSYFAIPDFFKFMRIKKEYFDQISKQRREILAAGYESYHRHWECPAYTRLIIELIGKTSDFIGFWCVALRLS